VKVPVQGAWTLRSEFAFLAGRPLETFGLDALHPYLRLPTPPRTLAHHLGDAGFATVFMHPFDLDFFNRREALPKLGFERLAGIAALCHATPARGPAGLGPPPRSTRRPCATPLSTQGRHAPAGAGPPGRPAPAAGPPRCCRRASRRAIRTGEVRDRPRGHR